MDIFLGSLWIETFLYIFFFVIAMLILTIAQPWSYLINILMKSFLNSKFYLWLFQVKKFAFGYHYMQPNETYHEPTRKFFRNEVFRIPIYEVLLLETIWQQCWVTDIQTFCKAPCRTLEYPWPDTVARLSLTPKLHRSEFRRAHFEKNFLVGLW